MQPNQPISSLGGKPSSWPSREPTYHPFGVQFEAGQLLTRTFSLWSKDIGRLIGINALPIALILVLGALGVGAAFAVYGVAVLNAFDDSAMWIPLAIGGMGFGIVSWLLYVAGQVGSFVAVEEVIRGEPPRIGAFGAITAGLSSMPALLGVYAVFAVITAVILVPVTGLTVAAIASESIGLGIGAFVVAMPSSVVICYVGLRLLTIAPVAAVVEELGPIAALRRSLELTKGNAIDLFVAALVFGVTLMGINICLSILGIIPIVGAFVQLASIVVLGSLQAVWATLAYAGLRDRLGR